MLFHKIRNLKIKCLILLFAIPLLVFVLLLFNLNFYFAVGLKACLGDCLIMISGRSFNLFFIITVLISTYVFREENKLMILKQTSKQVIYVRNFLTMTTIIFFAVFYIYFCAVLIGSFLSASFLNWGEQRSIYCVVTESTNPSVSFIQVFFVSFFYNFISVVMLNAIYVAFLFLTQKHIYGCLFLVGAVTIGYKVLKLFVDYHSFQSLQKTGVSILGFIIISMISFGIGYVKAERKDYLE